MKKKVISMAIASVLACSMLSSCIGQFALTSKLLTWNNQIGNKFVNELVFFVMCVIPVYEVTAMADVIVLNTIEFWSGTNPMAANAEPRIIEGNTGRYLVETDANGYTITSQNDGSVVRLDFNAEDNSWSIATENQEAVKFMTMVDANHVDVISPDGSFRTVELSQAGLMAYQQAVMPALASR